MIGGMSPRHETPASHTMRRRRCPDRCSLHSRCWPWRPAAAATSGRSPPPTASAATCSSRLSIPARTLNDRPAPIPPSRRAGPGAGDAGRRQAGAQAGGPKPKPAPKPAPDAGAGRAAPAPAPAPAAPAGLPSGTSFSAATDTEIRSHKNKVGDEVLATVGSDVKDASGRVVIPAGSKVTLQVTAIKESENKGDTTGTLTLKPTAISINGQSQPLPASISGVKTHAAGPRHQRGRHRQGRCRHRRRAPSWAG